MTDTRTILPIPIPHTPLIGRDHELTRVMDILAQGHRIVTITGIGGMGKTRLAIQVALEMEPDFDNGALVVPLAEIRSADQIPGEIARKLGYPGSDPDITRVVSLLSAGTRLLVLDNLEQIPAAGEIVAQLVAAHSGLTILNTSQAPLNIQGEHVFPLGSVPTPAADQPPATLRTNPAVMLFMHRATATDAQLELSNHDVHTIATICSTLEGIPLAIELAAARIQVLPPEALLHRLNARFTVLSGGSPHVPDRLRTMRSAITWSYDLLDSDERRVFRYLSVYAGGVSLDAITHTLNTLEITRTSWELIESFVGRSLLRRVQGGDAPRYSMLETLREFAHDQLETEGEALTARLAHARHIVNLAETAAGHLRGGEQACWFRTLGIDTDNIRIACEWSAIHRPEYAVRVIAAIWKYFEHRGEAVPYARLGHTLATDAIPDGVLAPGLLGIGGLDACTFRDTDAALTTLNRAVTIAQSIGDHRTEGRAHNALGAIERHLGNLDVSLGHYQRAVELATITGDPHDLFAASANVALNAFDRNDIPTARDRLRSALPIVEQTGNRTMINRAVLNLGVFQNRLGEYQSGMDYLTTALNDAREMGDTANEFYALLNLINSAVGLGDLDAAQSHFDQALVLTRRTNDLYGEVSIRTTFIEVYLEAGNRAAAAEQIVTIVSAAENEAFVDTLVACAGVAIGLELELDRLESAAALAGGYAAWQAKTSAHVSDRIAETIDAVAAALPDDAQHPARVAGKNARDWNYEELRLATLRAAQHYVRGRSDTSSVLLVPEPERRYNLTPRERDVLEHLVLGFSNAEIADTMFISRRTISTHVSNILAKLGVEHRTAATALAMSEGLV